MLTNLVLNVQLFFVYLFQYAPFLLTNFSALFCIKSPKVNFEVQYHLKWEIASNKSVKM